MGVFYDVRVHLADGSEDYVGKKGTTVAMGIRKAQYASFDMKQRSPTATTGRRQHSSVTHHPAPYTNIRYSIFHMPTADLVVTREGIHVRVWEGLPGGEPGEGGLLPRRGHPPHHLHQQPEQEGCQKY